MNMEDSVNEINFAKNLDKNLKGLCPFRKGPKEKKKGPGTSGKYIRLVLLRVKEIFHSN